MWYKAHTVSVLFDSAISSAVVGTRKETAVEKDKGEEGEKVHIHNHVTSKKQLLS